MYNAYVIEIEETAVGIAARDEGGFRFHAADHAFNALDGQLFATVRLAAAAARALTEARSIRRPDAPRRASTIA